jgi:hypothetical protein
MSNTQQRWHKSACVVLGADARQVALAVVVEGHALRHDVLAVLLEAGSDEVGRIACRVMISSRA